MMGRASRYLDIPATPDVQPDNLRFRAATAFAEIQPEVNKF